MVKELGYGCTCDECLTTHYGDAVAKKKVMIVGWRLKGGRVTRQLAATPIRKRFRPPGWT